VMELARNIALKSTSKFRLGAVLSKKNRVISTGYNQMEKTHPLMQKISKTNYTLGLHAEIHCCIGVSAKDLLNSDLYVYRVKRNLEPALARPCAACYTFLCDVGVRRVHFTTPNGVSTIRIRG